jgi:ABC-2 type transport system permease protein
VGYDTGVVAQVVGYLAIVTHLDNFSKGLLSMKDVIFYFSMIFFALFLALRSMESLRWRA